MKITRTRYVLIQICLVSLGSIRQIISKMLWLPFLKKLSNGIYFCRSGSFFIFWLNPALCEEVSYFISNLLDSVIPIVLQLFNLIKLVHLHVVISWYQDRRLSCFVSFCVKAPYYFSIFEETTHFDNWPRGLQ